MKPWAFLWFSLIVCFVFISPVSVLERQLYLWSVTIRIKIRTLLLQDLLSGTSMSDEVSSFMFWEGTVWLWYLWTIWENIWPHLFLSIIIIVYLKLYRSLYIVLKNVDLAFVNKQKRSGCYKMVVSAETYVCIHFKYTIYFWQQEVKKMLSRYVLSPR